MLTLYQFDYSPYCTKIRAVMHVKHLRYRTEELIPGAAAMTLRSISGQQRVPVLRDGARVIADSTEIALYLDTAYPEVRVIPEAYALYRECFLWEDWSDEALGPVVHASLLEQAAREPAFGREQVPPQGNAALDLLMPRLAPALLPMLRRHFGVGGEEGRRLASRLNVYLDFLTGAVATRRYLVGDRLTLADIAVATMTRHLERCPGGSRPELGTFFRWRDAILAECFIA